MVWVKSRLRRRRRCLRRFFDETGDRIARLSAFAEPILGPVKVKRVIVTFLPWLIRAEFLDEFAITGTAAISHNNAENRGIFGPNPLHANFNCHKKNLCKSWDG